MFLKLLFLCRVGIFVLVLTGLYYFAGYILSDLLKLEQKICRNTVMGFILQIALFECVALPFMIVKGSFYNMVYCYLGISFLFYVVGFLRLNIKMAGNKAESPWNVIRSKKISDLSFFSVLFLVLLLIHLFGVTVHQISMGDDAYYVSMATYAVEHDTLETNTMYITTGLYSVQDLRPNISAWEYYVGMLAVISNFHPAQMFHFILPLVLIPLSYMAYREVIQSLFKKENVAPYMMWFALLNIFFSFSAKLNSYNMFNCPWMGKVVLYNILMPMFLAFCILIIKAKNHTARYWVGIVLVLCAGVCATVVGVYMIPIYYAVIGISYVLTIRSLDELKKLILPVAITILPVLIVLVVILTSDAWNSIMKYAQTKPRKWMDVFINYWGIDAKPVLGIAGLVIFLTSVIMIWIHESKTVRIVLCYTTVFCALTIVNPLCIKLVSSYITGPDLYWRMFIIVPVVYVLPYLFVKFTLKIPKPAVLLTMLLVIAVCYPLNGSAFSNKEIFSSYETTYGIKRECVAVSNYILKETKDEDKSPVVMYSPALREGLRQYTTKLDTWMARNYYHGGIPTGYGDMKTVCHKIFYGEYTEAQTYKVLKSLNTDYIVVRKKIKYKDKTKFKKKKRYGKYVIYQVQ